MAIHYRSWRSIFSGERGDKVHLEVQRQLAQLSFDVPVVLREHEMDQITALADPAKNLVRPLGIVGIEIDKKLW